MGILAALNQASHGKKLIEQQRLEKHYRKQDILKGNQYVRIKVRKK
jgi:hypothetical protein